MALSYEFSIGSVRAKEKNLFTNSDIEHMLGCENVNELCRYLSDKGYGEGDNIEDILKSHSEMCGNISKEPHPILQYSNRSSILTTFTTLKLF